MPDNDEELRKRITAKLIGSTAFFGLDNIDEPLKSGALAAALTSMFWEDRILGLSEAKRIPNRTAWVATGINVTMSRDIARRTVVCRLLPGVENPHERTDFKHTDLLAWVRENRSELASAVLTIAQAWVAAGRPKVAHPAIGSFEAWAGVMAGVLGAAGIEGFLNNFKESSASADVESEEWSALVEEWAKAHYEGPVMTVTLVALADEKGLLQAFWGTGYLDGQSKAKKLGVHLGKLEGRIFKGYRIAKAKRIATGRPWRLQAVEASEPEPF
jgi:putative DNA primase/helicase